MEFRLTHEGVLKSKSNVREKHEIRKAFHVQLKRLWGLNPVLIDQGSRMMDTGQNYTDWAKGRYSLHGFNWLPLVNDRMSLFCKLDVLILRFGNPGGIFSNNSSDIDNKLKTLFDALKIPRDPSAIRGETPTDDEDPFYVLLEDDRLITNVALETDTLLQPYTPPNGDPNDVRVVIKVLVKPFKIGIANMDYGI